MIGFGSSSKPQDFSYALEDQAGICELLLDRFKAGKVHVVGHSMGGAIGLLLADRISDRLVSLINVEGNLIGQDCGLLSRKTASVSLKEFKKGVFQNSRLAVQSLEGPGSRLWVEWSSKVDLLGFYRSSKSLVEWSDSGKLLRKFLGLEVSKAYFYGEKNSNKEVLAGLQGVSRISISHSGHFVMNDNPAEFYSKLAQALRSELANRT